MTLRHAGPRIARRCVALAAAAALSGCSVDVRQCQSSADCGAGKTCDQTSLSGYGVCRSACGDTACTSSQACVSGACVARPPAFGAATVTANATAGGWYPRSATSAVPVSVATTDYGSGIVSVSLTAGGQAVAGAFDGAGKSTFLVPTSVQAAAHENPLAFTLTATDRLGNVVTAAPTNGAVLRIDDLGPSISGVSLSNPDAVATVPFFRQLDASGNDTLGPVDVRATILDGGAGLAPASLKLVLQSDGTTRVDLPGAVTRDTGTDVWHFKIPRVSAQVASGKQGVIQFRVIAADALGNPQQADGTPLAGGGTVESRGAVGIDGQPPQVTLDLTVSGEYPAPNAGCDTATAGLVCGHDGTRFWRKGDDGWVMFYGANDNVGAPGSGMATSAGAATCAIAGQAACSAAYNATNGRFEFAVKPSQVAFTSDANGEGTATVTVSARDQVGNAASATAQIKLTRLRWMVPLPASFGPVKTAPDLVPIGSSHFLLLGGSGTAAANTIAQISESGTLALTGSAQAVGPITDNMAFSPITGLLYAVQEGSQRMFAFSVTSSGFTGGGYLCDLGNGVRLNGAPAIIYDGPTERVLVTDSGSHSLLALSGSNGQCGSFPATPMQVIGSGTVASPSTDGTRVYVSYQNTGLARVLFSGGSFSSLVTQNLSLASQVGLAALVQTQLFVGSNQGFVYKSFPADLTSNNLWTGAGAGAMADMILSSPVVNGGLVFGAADANDGFLRAFQVADGSLAFSYNPTGASKNALSAVAIAGSATPVYYFGDGSGELNAVVQSGTSGAQAPNWNASFKGQSALGGRDVSFSGSGTEAAIGPDGTLYFAANAAGGANPNVYAIMTDSGPAVVPGGANWPRVGFDNCNSNNSSLTNCQ